MEGLASQLIDTYLELEHQSQQLKLKLRSLHEYDAFTLGLNDTLWREGSDPIQQSHYHHYWASEIIGCLDHRHDGDGRDTWQMAGALVVPEPIIELAQELNTTKTLFASLIQQYRSQQQTPTTPLQLQRLFENQAKPCESKLGSGHDARTVMKRIGASRIHLRHCTRHVICLKSYPKFMSLSWVRQRRSIQKISVQQCIAKLEKPVSYTHLTLPTILLV